MMDLLTMDMEKDPRKIFKKKKVICSIYHIDEEKFSSNDLEEFNERDRFVDFIT